MVVKLTLYTDQNQFKGMSDFIIQKFWMKQCALLTFETVDTASPADETTALNATCTAHLDGTTTPVRMGLKCTSSKDCTVNATGVTGILAMGLAATDASTPGVGIPKVVTLGMPTSKTAQRTYTTYWVRFYGMVQASAGSEGDAAGSITFTTATAKYATITAAGTMSSVGRLYIPAGWAACCFRADWSQNQAVTTTAHAFYSVRYVGFQDEYYNVAGATGTIVRDRFSFGTYGGGDGSKKLREIPLRGASTATSYMTFYGDLIAGTLTGSVKFYVLLVKL